MACRIWAKWYNFTMMLIFFRWWVFFIVAIKSYPILNLNINDLSRKVTFYRIPVPISAGGTVENDWETFQGQTQALPAKLRGQNLLDFVANCASMKSQIVENPVDGYAQSFGLRYVLSRTGTVNKDCREQLQYKQNFDSFIVEKVK